MRIRQNGDFEFCRWANEGKNERKNIKDISIIEYFQKNMSNIRKDLLEGKKIDACQPCYVMEQHNKISGRQKQLLKVGILPHLFEKSFNSSTLIEKFRQSLRNGDTDLMPVDWQIDLGNYCNSACVMCSPQSSSRLANEWYELGFIDKPYNNWSWTQDRLLLKKFVEDLLLIKNIQYLHFLGGETLITPGFIEILNALLDANLNDKIIIGLTTNLTVWPDKTIELLKKFKQVHFGMSIETLDSVNDYVRWPSNIKKVKNNLDKFVKLAKEKKWDAQIRVTPSILTVNRVVSLYEYAYDNQLGIEACNFLYKPVFLKMNTLPIDLRQPIIEKLKKFVGEYNNSNPIINTRRSATIQQSVKQDAISMINYLQNEPYDDKQSISLINFLKVLEGKRKNKIIDYLPEYEEFLRSIGY